MEPPSSSSQPLTFYDFLDRMRHPASLDLVRSIKSFIVSFSFHPPSPEDDGKRVQDFFLTMEAAIRDHPLWTASSDDGIDHAMEGLEKYIMTKLYSRTFGASPEDLKLDQEISEKIELLQTFLKPEHLDIPQALHNEGSWLIAEKELLKINAFKAPREKLMCIMNCCRVINNLLLNAAMSDNHMLAGADDFLPVLIYVLIKANPPQLQSNLKFIQLYRRQAKLVSEAAYYFTNIVSAKAFIVDMNAKSLTMDEMKFEESMKVAKMTRKETESSIIGKSLHNQTDPKDFNEVHDREKDLSAGSGYPYLEAKAEELTVRDVDRLLNLYKGVVSNYTNLCRAINSLSMSEKEPLRLFIEGITPQPEKQEGTYKDLKGRSSSQV